MNIEQRIKSTSRRKRIFKFISLPLLVLLLVFIFVTYPFFLSIFQKSTSFFFALVTPLFGTILGISMTQFTWDKYLQALYHFRAKDAEDNTAKLPSSSTLRFWFALTIVGLVSFVILLLGLATSLPSS